MRRLAETGVALLVLAAPALALAALGEDSAHARAGGGPVVFVCEHGNVKSLIARELFNRLAAERGLAVHAVSRGLSPELTVPAPIVEMLRADGFLIESLAGRGAGR